MIDLEFRLQATPPEKVSGPASSGILAIASFIIHYLGWQAERGLGALARNGDYPPTGLFQKITSEFPTIRKLEVTPDATKTSVQVRKDVTYPLVRPARRLLRVRPGLRP